MYPWFVVFMQFTGKKVHVYLLKLSIEELKSIVIIYMFMFRGAALAFLCGKTEDQIILFSLNLQEHFEERKSNST